MKYTESGGQPVTCAACGALVAATLLVCPSCGALMRSDELKQLAAAAGEARSRNDVRTEIAHWRSALELLPAGSQQHTHVLARVQELSRLLDSGQAPKPIAPPPPPPPGSDQAVNPPPPAPAAPKSAGRLKSIGAAVAIVGMVLLKSKTLLVLLLTKGKLLLMGLTKASTFFTMLASLGLYWSLWGWKFAGGLVLGIYIHEMGHVYALRRLGIKASAPMFIPGLGAVVRLKEYPADAREDARIGLAGPIWGLAASFAFYAIYLATSAPIWAAISYINAWINMFNLIPIAPLDGGRGFRALVQWQRWTITGCFFAAWILTHDGLLALLGIVAAIMSFRKAEPGTGDRRAFVEYVMLIAALAILVYLRLPDSLLR